MCSKINTICLIGPAIGKVASSAFDGVARAFGNAAAKVTSWMWTVISETTRVDLSGGWFHSALGITAPLAGVIILAIFVLELIKAVLRREPGVLSRATVGIGAGLLGAAAAIGVVEALLAATDALSDGIVRTVGLGSVAKLGTKIAPAGAIAGLAEPALILIMGLGYLLASFFVWAVFIARKAMIIVAAVFAPIAFSGAAARATSGWVRKWVEFTVAMVFSKLVVVIIFTLALSLVGDPGTGMAAVGAVFSGLALMVIACFAPWMLLRLVHFIGGDVMAAHHQGLQQSVMAAGATPVNMARSGASKVSGVVGAGASTSGGKATQAAPGAATGTSVVKPTLNNPVIKNASGGNAGGATGPAGSRPKDPTPPGPQQPGPPGQPPDQGSRRPNRPTQRQQPAPLPAGP